jgi:hypothetical protein
MSTRGRSGRGGPTARGTGRGRSRGRGAHTPHPKPILKHTHNPSRHINFLDPQLQLLNDLLTKTGLPATDPSIVAIRNLLPTITAPTVNTTKFDTEFRQNGYQETDPKEIKQQLEESGEIKLENPLDIIDNADKLSKDKDKLAELSKEYITLMEDLNMPANFYK